MLTIKDFDTAAVMFRKMPCAESLSLLTAVGQVVMVSTVARESEPFITVTEEGDLPCDFQQIRATFGRELTDDELSRASGAIGYSLRIYVAGEELGDPQLVSAPGAPTVALYAYDATKARRSDPNIAEALKVAIGYIADGSPVRRSDRAGIGTRGTRLVQGIGPVAVTFAIR